LKERRFKPVTGGGKGKKKREFSARKKEGGEFSRDGSFPRSHEEKRGEEKRPSITSSHATGRPQLEGGKRSNPKKKKEARKAR